MGERPEWLFVDLDGTLTDTLPTARAVYERFASVAGFAPTEAEFVELNGPSLPEIVALLHARHQLLHTVEALVARYRTLWDEGLSGAPVKGGALTMLGTAAALGIPVAIVTSGSTSFAERFIAAHRPEIAFVVSGDDVERSKPAPHIYRIALGRAHCAPEAALAVEDSVNGVRAAVDAGIRTIALSDGSPHAAPREALVRAGAALVIEHLSAVFGAET